MIPAFRAWRRFGLSCPCLVLGFWLAACGALDQADFQPTPPAPAVYDYPIADPLAATIIGTPKADQARLARNYPRREIELTVFPDRQVPEVLWYHARLKVALASQPGPAPLVFSIAGTGAAHDSLKMRSLEAILVNSGFHVLSIGSPSHPNFIAAGAHASLPGRPSEDARDLMRVMAAALEAISDSIEISGFHLVGYSLGALQAAHIAALDAEDPRFDFGKVLLINPPASLTRSMALLDAMLTESLPGGAADVDRFFEDAFAGISELYGHGEFVDFSDDFLYRAYETLDPDQRQLKALIGLAFRMSATDMIFTADVMNGGGFLVPEGRDLVTADSLTGYFQAGARVGFSGYLDDYLAPRAQAVTAGLTLDALKAEGEMAALAPYLASAEDVWLMTNADDVILAPGDLEILKGLFGPRAIIHPSGGHLGNLEHRAVAAEIAAFFRGGSE